MFSALPRVTRRCIIQAEKGPGTEGGARRNIFLFPVPKSWSKDIITWDDHMRKEDNDLKAKRIKPSFVLGFAALFILLSACGRGGAKPVEADQTTILYTSLDETVDYEELRTFLSDRRSIDELCERLGMEQYKRLSDICCYTVLKTTEGPVWVPFDEEAVMDEYRLITFSDINNEPAIRDLPLTAGRIPPHVGRER